MTWYCEGYGQQAPQMNNISCDCENCYLGDECKRDSLLNLDEVPFFLTRDEAMLVSEMFDSHTSEISEKVANQLLQYQRFAPSTRIDEA